jgi:putative transcriptional regulator
MPMVHKTLAELERQPFEFSAEERARLDALTDEDIVAAAESDPDNPPWTDEELARGQLARGMRQAREKLGLSQDALATALEVPVATLRNWEQGRFTPDPAARALMRLVARDPEHALKVLAR